MIRVHVSAALLVLDGLTGKPPPPSALRCFLDGAPVRTLVKDGYHVLTNLTSGSHELVFRGVYYLEERIPLEIDASSTRELLVMMKPGANYPFGGSVTWLTLQLKEGRRTAGNGKLLWIAVRDPRQELRIAQNTVAAGEQTGRLFGPAVTTPKDYLLLDGARSEICRLAELDEETGQFDAPLRYGHKRGCCLLPAQRYVSGEAGTIRAVFREPLPVEILPETGGKPVSLTLEAGENTADIPLKKPTHAKQSAAEPTS